MVGNQMRWKPGKRGHYEGYYVAFNDPESHRGFWIRYSMVAPSDEADEPRAQVWLMRTDREQDPRNRAIRQTFPIQQLQASEEPFFVDIAGNRLRADGCQGAVADNGTEASWDLSFDAMLPPIAPTPEWGARVATCFLEPHPLLRITGSITEGNRETRVDGWLGEQAHVFGKRHSQRWHWAECKHLGAPGRAFTGFAAWPSLPGGERSITSLYLELGDGRRLLRNRFREMLKPQTAHSPGGWEFNAEYARDKLAGSVRPDPADLIGVTYHDPSGQPIYCYHSELADFSLQYYRRSSRSGAWNLVEDFSAPHSSAFEYGSAVALEGIPLLLS
jgi:hypothetical protein